MTDDHRRKNECDTRVEVFEPRFVSAAGQPPKEIAEHIGRLASGDEAVSLAVMKSPPGWTEPAQTPDFDEFTLVLAGELHVLADEQTRVVRPGEAVRVRRGTRVQYATPAGAHYVAVCLPAFSPALVHRG